MCWSIAASVGMVVGGIAATVLSSSRKQPKAITFTLGYFTAMEALQASGYLVIDDCGGSANRTITLLSFLHIVFQPFFINAFAMELVPQGVRTRVCITVYVVCAVSAAVMLLQLAPLEGVGSCRPGDILCGLRLCLVSGEWHIAWQIPYNGLLAPFDESLGTNFAFPTYVLTVFLLPFLYGAWRFCIMHLVLGPLLANVLTNNPNEWPAVWCLFSIVILIIGLSPWMRARFTTSTWWLWPRSWSPQPTAKS